MVSRLNDRCRNILLFADRVKPDDLALRPDSIPKPLAVGQGFDHVADLADQMNILITGHLTMTLTRDGWME